MPQYNLDTYIGKVILLRIPNVKRRRYRWIVKKQVNGRYVVRAPKVGVLHRELRLKRPSDFGKETLLHKDAFYE